MNHLRPDRPREAAHAGVAVELPEGAAVIDRSAEGLVIELDGAGPVPARVVVTVERVDAGLETLAEAAVQRRVLGGDALIDRGPARMGSWTADRALWHRTTGDHGVTIEEWRAVHDGRLVTLSAGCATSAYPAHGAVFASVAAGVEPDDRAPASDGEIEYRPATLSLTAPAAVVDALLANGDELPAGIESALREAGVVSDDGPDLAIEPALRAVADPAARVVLAADHETAQGWLSEHHVVLVFDEPGDRRRLVLRPAALLPAEIAALVGLGPAPAPEDRTAIQVAAPDLARLIAAERGEAPPAPPGAFEATTAVAGLRRHWRVDAHWLASDERQMLEVIAAASGLWLVVPSEPVRLEPTTPTEVWKHLSELIPGA